MNEENGITVFEFVGNPIDNSCGFEECDIDRDEDMIISLGSILSDMVNDDLINPESTVELYQMSEESIGIDSVVISHEDIRLVSITYDDCEESLTMTYYNAVDGDDFGKQPQYGIGEFFDLLNDDDFYSHVSMYTKA